MQGLPYKPSFPPALPPQDPKGPRVNEPIAVAGSHNAGALERAKAEPPTVRGASSRRRPSPSPAVQPPSKSSRPGIVRFFGRRNTVGNIVPLTQTDILLPAPWIRPALTVGAAAFGSFLIVAALLWVFGPKTAVQPAPLPPPPPLRALAVPARSLPPPPPSPDPAPSVDADAIKPRPTNAKATRLRTGGPKPRKPTDPDAPLPPTFF